MREQNSVDQTTRRMVVRCLLQLKHGSLTVRLHNRGVCTFVIVARRLISQVIVATKKLTNQGQQLQCCFQSQ